MCSQTPFLLHEPFSSMRYQLKVPFKQHKRHEGVVYVLYKPGAACPMFPTHRYLELPRPVRQLEMWMPQCD